MIRPAHGSDLPAIERVYAAARAYMAASGNPHQWGDTGFPRRDDLENEIEKQRLYVIEENGAVHSAFAFVPGPDPTYGYIEGGRWLNDRPYAAIHKVASDGQIKGVFTRLFDFCRARSGELRIDTHRDNKTMQHVVEKHGFIRCGIIYLQNGDPRIAYHYSKEA